MAELNQEAPEQWVCGICLEVDARPRTLHECGNHEFHRVCLARVRDPRCPICRFEDPSLSTLRAQPRPPQLRTRNVFLQATRRSSLCNFGCSFCGTDIPRYAEYVVITPCQHALHPTCAITVLQRFGITPRGLLYCRTCSQR